VKTTKIYTDNGHGRISAKEMGDVKKREVGKGRVRDHAAATF
jgi:hypothetical protein